MMTLKITLLIIGAILIGYIFGSIPNALIIGKLFYKKDVRKEGSGNLGATNVARTLGAKPGILVLLLDALKSAFSSNIIYVIARFGFHINDSLYLTILFCLAGLFACIGHCFPIFAKFKGGKAVSVVCGFVLGSNWIFSLIGAAIFFIVFFAKRIVSISSILMAFFTSCISFIPIFYKGFYILDESKGLIYSITLCLISIILIARHKSNIIKLIHHEEKQFSIKKKDKD